ncbi:MAG: hypothetical protein ABI947_23855 [Chloroflexota bacterium]
MTIKVSVFVKTVPEVARDLLPANLRDFQVALMPWLAQLYYEDKRLHYELVKLPDRYGENRLEIGLHFESQDHALNELLLTGFERYLFEVREALGDNWYAEAWDKGWTKIYTTASYIVMDDEFLQQTAKQLADAITVMQPIYRLVSKREKIKSR